MTSTFDCPPRDREPLQLRLTHVKSYDDGAIWIRRDVINDKFD